jgi:methionyl aminopeptidase
MSVVRRNAAEIAVMRKAGRVVAQILEAVAERVRPGVTTAELDKVAREVLERAGARSNFLHYRGYPAVICTSPNDVVVHGIPSEDVVLREGDIVSIDAGAIVEGYHGDAAVTVAVGEIGDLPRRLIVATQEALEAGIAQARPGAHLHDIGAAVEKVASHYGFSVVRDYVGHGIGTRMHEDPPVPNYWPGYPGMLLKSGFVLAIEPMVNAGGPGTRVLKDGWSVVTADGSLSAHFEHTVAVGEDGPEILTRHEVVSF